MCRLAVIRCWFSATDILVYPLFLQVRIAILFLITQLSVFISPM